MNAYVVVGIAFLILGLFEVVRYQRKVKALTRSVLSGSRPKLPDRYHLRPVSFEGTSETGAWQEDTQEAYIVLEGHRHVGMICNVGKHWTCGLNTVREFEGYNTGADAVAACEIRYHRTINT